MSVIYGFGALFTVLFAGIPLWIAMGIVGYFGFWLLTNANPAGAMVAQTVWDTLNSYSLSVLPLFVLMGNLINHSGLSRDLYAAANAMVGHKRGGLAMSTILSSGGFAAVCGSSLATSATMSAIAMPSMRRYGYDDRLSSASVAAGGTLGILIPPSTIMVIYGTLTETSIGKLFIAGIVPGFLAILFYLATVAFVVRRHPEYAPPTERMDWRERRQALGKVWAIVLLFAVVMGGIYFGVFTATEAAGIGAAGAFVIALARRTLTFAALVDIFSATVRMSCSLMAILVGALIFANFINVTGAPGMLVGTLRELDLSPTVVMLCIVAFYIALGAVFDELAMIMLTVPVIFPLVMEMGYDPVWFGIIIVMVVEIGLICPPIGMNLFIIRSAVPDITMQTLFRGIAPFVVVDILRLMLFIFVPAIVMFLPTTMAR